MSEGKQRILSRRDFLKIAGSGATALSIASLLPFGVKGQDDVLKIGALFDYTGPVADLGPKFEAGLNLALEEVNYEVAGRKIKPIIEDSATSVGVALERFKKLVNQDKVNIVIGPIMGDAHPAIAPVAREEGVIVTSLFNGMYEVAKNPDSTYLITPTTCYAQTYWFGEYLYKEMGYKSMATITANYAGKIAYAGGVADAFKAAGGTVVAELWPPVGCPDYSPYIPTLRDTQADVILYALEGPGPVARFLYQAAEMGVERPKVTITQDGDYTPETLRQLGDIALGIRGESQYTWQLDNPANKKFVEKMTPELGHWPSAAPVNSYTPLKAILAGLRATEGDDSVDALWPAVLSLELDVPAGPLSFTSEGVGVCNSYVTKAEKVEGKYRLSAPLETVHEIRDPRLPSSEGKPNYLSG